MTNPILNGPQAPENNPPIQPQFFQPSRFVISAIVLGTSTTVTTIQSDFGVDNDFVIGQHVRFLIPNFYGTVQLNEQTGVVTAIPGFNQVTVDIDTSRNYNAFIPSPAYGPTKPQLIPIGDINSGTINANGRILNGTTIPGAFRNISP